MCKHLLQLTFVFWHVVLYGSSTSLLVALLQKRDDSVVILQKNGMSWCITAFIVYNICLC